MRPEYVGRSGLGGEYDIEGFHVVGRRQSQGAAISPLLTFIDVSILRSIALKGRLGHTLRAAL